LLCIKTTNFTTFTRTNPAPWVEKQKHDDVWKHKKCVYSNIWSNELYYIYSVCNIAHVPSLSLRPKKRKIDWQFPWQPRERFLRHEVIRELGRVMDSRHGNLLSRLPFCSWLFSPFKGPMTAVTEALDSDWEIDRRFARRIDDKQPSVASLVRKSCARVCSARACAPFCPGPAAARAQDEWLTDGTAERADAHRESSRCSVCVLWGFASDTLWERDSWGTRLGITADSPGGFSLLSSERNARDTVSDDG